MPVISGSGGGSGGGMARLFTSTLSGAAASIDTGANGIPSGSSHLLVVMKLRASAAATVDTCTLTFNGDTGTNYYMASGEFFGTTANAIHTEAAANLSLESVSAATAPADVFSPIVLFVPAYTDAHKKSVNGLAGYRTGNASGNVLAKALIGYWDATAAINQIMVSTASTFVAGSSLTVYGLA